MLTTIDATTNSQAPKIGEIDLSFVIWSPKAPAEIETVGGESDRLVGDGWS